MTSSSPDTAPTLVAGATGSLGLEVCERLAGSGTRLRALVRADSSASSCERLRALGAELVVGDLKRPDTLAGACAGARTVISTASATLMSHRRDGDSIATVDRDGQCALIDAAATAGAGRLLYVSSASTDDSPATRAKRDVEAHLRSSGVPFTVLRPLRFMEIWFAPQCGFDVAAGQVRVFGAGDRRISWMSRSDVGAFAAMCAEDPAAEGEMIDLGGPEALTQLEAIEVFELVSGRRIERIQASERELRADVAAAKDPLLRSYATFMLDCALHERVVEMDGVLARHPVRLTSVREYAERTEGRG